MKPLSCLLILMSSSLTGCRGQILPLPSPNRGGSTVNTWLKKNDKASVQHSFDPNVTPAFTSALTNPSLIVVSVTIRTAGSILTPTDTAGNTYVDSGASGVPGDGGTCRIFYALNTHTTASNVVSISNPLSKTMTIVAMEFTGGVTVSPVRAFATNPTVTASGANMTSTAIAGTVAGDLLVGSTIDFNVGSGLSAGSGYTASSDPSCVYNLNGAGGSIAVLWTTTNTNEAYGAIGVAFKPGP
jgi:hypothetical protein